MKRKRLILVGNGLDLSLGLKTGYEDFAVWYFKLKIRETIDHGKKGFDSRGAIDQTFILLSQKERISTEGFEKCLRRFVEELNSVKYLSELQVALQKNQLKIKWSLPFYERLFNCDTWGDIERSYYVSLIQLIKPLDVRAENSVNFEKDQLNKVKWLNNLFSNLRDSLECYIINENRKLSGLLREKAYLIPFFQTVVTGNSHQGETWDLVLDFNYTDTIPMILENQEKWRWVQLIKIHGNLNPEDIRNSIVFGYGDDYDSYYENLENLNHPEFVQNIKSYYYSKNKNYDELLHFLSNALISTKEFEVHIIGHSCGISDRTMLKTIFEHDNCAAIYNYHWRDKVEDCLKDHFEKDINVSRHFDDKIKKRDRFKPFDSK